jgi:CRP-like cAMP-binding protein
MGCSTSKQDADDDLRHVSKALGGSGAPRKRVLRAGAVSRERQMSFIMKRQLERRPSGRRATITDDYEHAFVPKTAEQSAFLLGALQSHHIFEGAEPTGIERCVEALAPRVVQPGETLVEFGARGHEFFIVGTGLFECFLPDKANEGEFVSSGTFAAGECFGELALLYGGRRAATVTASTKGEDGAPLTDGMTVWTISADVFQNTLSAAMQGEKARRLAILQQVPLFHTLSEHQLNRLCETAQRVFFPPDTTVIKKGDAGGTMYVIVSGSVEVSELSSNFTKMTLGPGKLFGEKGALTEGGATRDSTAVTADDTVCLAMTQRSLNLGGAFNELAAIITGHGDEVLFHHLQLLDGMPGEGKRELRKACKMVSYDAADEIFVQGELGATFYIMKEGRAKVRRAFQSTRHLDLTGAMDAMAAAAAPSFEGRGDRRLKRSGTVTADVSSAPKQAGGRLIAGDFFGDDALEDATGKGKMRQTTIIAETKCTCFEISADKFTKLTRKWQGISKKVARHYIRRRIELAMSVPASYIDLLDLEPVSVLGTGAYGRVRLSRQKLSGDPFAVKVMRKVNIRSKGDEQYVAQEIEVMKVMNHPFILRLAAAHHTDRNLYLVLEICVGGELFNFIHAECEDHRLEEKVAAFYVGCIVEALAHMHQQFIAYRDLKPENLLIDQEGYIKVVDFGFAKKIVGKTYSQVGTPEYYAPELVNPSKVSLLRARRPSQPCCSLGSQRRSSPSRRAGARSRSGPVGPRHHAIGDGCWLLALLKVQWRPGRHARLYP